MNQKENKFNKVHKWAIVCILVFIGLSFYLGYKLGYKEGEFDLTMKVIGREINYSEEIIPGGGWIGAHTCLGRDCNALFWRDRSKPEIVEASVRVCSHYANVTYPGRFEDDYGYILRCKNSDGTEEFIWN